MIEINLLPDEYHPRKKTNHMIFVIQDHHAHRAGRHFDLRLEWSGSLEKYAFKRNFNQTPEPSSKHEATRVMRSWAIPKHRLPDVGEKLLAVPTEDHQMEYNDFVDPGEEAEIPSGYGAGTVILAARGPYRLEKLGSRGTISFTLGPDVEYCRDDVQLGRFTLIPFKKNFLLYRKY